MTSHVFMMAPTAISAPPRARSGRLFALADLPLYALVASIPFETVGSVNGDAVDVTVSRWLGVIWALSCLFQGHLRRLRFDRTVALSTLFLFCLIGRGIFVDASMRPEVTRIVLQLIQLTVMFWLVTISARVRPNLYENVAWVYGLSCSVFAILQAVGLTVWDFGEDRRISGLGENANTFAGKLAIGLIILIGFIWNRKKLSPWITLPVAATWPLSILAIMKSGSRGAMLAVAVGLTVLGIPKMLRGKSLARIATFVVLTVVVGSIMYSISQTDVATTRWTRTLVNGELARRELVYPQAMEMAIQKPFVGWGPAQNYATTGQRIGADGPRSTENTILWSLTAVGFLGAAPFLYVLYIAGVSAWRLRRTALQWIPFATFMTTLAVANTIEWYHVKVLWLVLGITIGAVRSRPRKRRPARRLRAPEPLPVLEARA